MAANQRWKTEEGAFQVKAKAGARALEQEHAGMFHKQKKVRVAGLNQRWREMVGEVGQIPLGMMGFVRS